MAKNAGAGTYGVLTCCAVLFEKRARNGPGLFFLRASPALRFSGFF